MAIHSKRTATARAWLARLARLLEAREAIDDGRACSPEVAARVRQALYATYRDCDLMGARAEAVDMFRRMAEHGQPS